MVAQPHGIVLVTGPTGSGKTTTLYSTLKQLARPEVNVCTIEDPIEMVEPAFNQMQVQAHIELGFASGVRALLRQDPDIVMIGEIRDFETADIAMKTSLTGQLELSTLHTNDAPSAVTRLIDMGVEPFLVASSVSLIQAQRLIRKLCLKCKEPTKPDQKVLDQLGFNPSKASTYFKPKGCVACNGMGYKGRMGIIEVCMIDDHIRDLIVSRAQSWEIKEHAVKNLGMITLRDDGLRKASMGITSLDEVLRATTEE
jgi:general secretion pathway protein E